MAGKPQTLATTSAFEILGPVMVGPSSSHTAGALRCAQVAASLLEGRITKVTFGLWNSFAHTYRGHGTDRALVAGILGLDTDDENIKQAFDLAREQGLEYHFDIKGDDASIHPNTVGIDMVVIPGDTSAEVISGLIADEAAIGMVNSKTTAVRVIPAIGRKAGEVLDFGGLLGYGPIMAVNQHDPSVFINRGGRLPAPMQSLKN